MIPGTAILKYLSLHSDQWILMGCALLFFLWILSRHEIWLPCSARHPLMTDMLIILSSTIFILAPLTQAGAPGGHDYYFHLSRVAELDWLFRDGHYYGRWAPDFNFGFGYPLFNFYPSLIYYIAQIFQACGIGIVDSLKWVIVSGTWLSGFFMYIFGKEFWGRHGGVVCAIAYIYVPYRIVNLYVRGAIPEFYSMTFMPLIFWSFYKIVRTGKLKYVVIGSISYGFMIPTHNVTALFLTMCLIAYSLFLLIEEWAFSGKHRKETFARSCALFTTAVLGITLVAIYWLPAMYEKQFVKISSLDTGYHDVAVHFVYFSQFFSRFWGYGGSGRGPDDGMSFQLGIEHVILAIISAIVVLYVRRSYPRQRNHTLFCGVLIAGLMFAMTSQSLFLWRTFPLIGFISFPWRLLSLTAFALSFLCGGIFLINFDTLLSRWRRVHFTFCFGNRIVQLIITAFLLLFTVGYCHVGGLLPLSDHHFSRELLRESDGAAMNNEYLPIWVDDPDDTVKGGDIQITTGDAEIYDIHTKMLSYQFMLESKSLAAVRIGTVYFPGWKAYRNGKFIPLAPEPATGLLTFNVPQGKHLMEIHFEDTIIRQIGAYITLGTLGILCALVVTHYVKRKS